MRRLSVRVALAVSMLGLLALTAAAAGAGYLIKSHSERADPARRLAAAEAYVEQHRSAAQTPQSGGALARRLDALRLGAALTLVSPTSKQLLFSSVGNPGRAGSGPANDPGSSNSAGGRPTASYVIPLADGSGRELALDLYARAPDTSRQVLVGLAAGLGALLAGGMVLFWATGRWLVAPLRRLNAQVEAVAGGDAIGPRACSPIREVDNVAAAVTGMAVRLGETAEQDARLEAERRLLVSAIAHDLRTPLFSLRGYLDAIASGIGDPHERLNRARDKAQQIDRLVTDLFSYARSEIRAAPELQATDLGRAVSDATASFELAAEEHGVELRVTGSAGTTVRIDRDAFDRALANILENALRHTPKGRAIDITSGEDARGPFIHVVDDGPGIAPDLLPRVFEPTVRADNTSENPTDGAGLGLAIAARLLHNHGGTIRAANAPGRGAILTLRLPPTTESPRR
jgi:signal transduction histidine kinase